MKLWFLLAGVAALGCSKSEFSEQRSDPKAFVDSEDKQEEETLASEPVMIGGGFLACFASQPDEVGCNLYEDEKYKNRMAVDTTMVLESLSDSVSQVVFDPTHPSWTWRFLFKESPASKLELKALVGSQEIELSVPIQYILPGSLLLAGELLGVEIKLRDKKSGLCLSGNSNWSIVESPGTPTEYQKFVMQLEDCQNAIEFQWAQWSTDEKDRFRLHALGPEIHPDSCDPDFFVQGLCQRACLDLAEFGVGPQVELFGCTYFENTEKAQRITLKLKEEGSFSLEVNELPIGYLDASSIEGKSDLEPLVFEMFVSEKQANAL